MQNLKLVYKAFNKEMSLINLDLIQYKWDNKYYIVIDSWYNLFTYFDYIEDIRRLIYTINALEGFNRQLRKYTKIKTVFIQMNLLKKL